MRKSNNYFKFLEYVTYGKDHDNTIDKGNGVLECRSYVSISDIEDRYKTTFGLENEWLILKNILINEDTLYVYYIEGENSKLVAVYLLDNFKTQKELKDSITTACVEFLYEVLLEKSDIREETEETEDCKTVKDVMEAKQGLNTCFGKEISKTPSLLDVMQCMMCPADRQGNRCCGEQWCKQTWKRYKAIVNPEWHHVSLATLANIDFDMLDEKRKLVFDINQILKDGIRNLYKCENHISFEVLERYVIRKCDELIRHNRLKAFWFSYIARQLDEVRRNTIYLYAPYITAHRNRW